MIENILSEAANILTTGWTQDIDEVDFITRFNTIAAIDEAASRLSADEASKLEAYRAVHNTVLRYIKENGPENLTDDRADFYELYEHYANMAPLKQLKSVDECELVIMYDMDENRSKREVLQLLADSKVVLFTGKLGKKKK